MTAATSSYFARRLLAGPSKNVTGWSRCSVTHPTGLTWIVDTCHANAVGSEAATISPGSAAPETWSRGSEPSPCGAVYSILGSDWPGRAGPSRRPVTSTRSSAPSFPATTATGVRSTMWIDTVCGQLVDTDAVATHGNASSTRSAMLAGSID